MKLGSFFTYLILLFVLISCAETDKIVSQESIVNEDVKVISENTDDETYIVYEGRYRGDNIYIQNPLAGNGDGYCVIRVEVNGEVVDCSITTSAFEIDLSTFGLKEDDPIVIKVSHKTDCQPKVLNPGANGPKRSVTFTKLKIDNNILSWAVENLRTDSCYYIEQYQWNRWQVIGKVETTVESKLNIEEFFHSGTNKFRIKQYGKSGYPTTSSSVSIDSDLSEITFDKDYKSLGVIIFSKESKYQLYNLEGEMVLSGKSKQIDLSQLPNGTYYLNFDNTTGKVIKLKR
jgi:hypothetical protein